MNSMCLFIPEPFSCIFCDLVMRKFATHDYRNISIKNKLQESNACAECNSIFVCVMFAKIKQLATEKDALVRSQTRLFSFTFFIIFKDFLLFPHRLPMKWLSGYTVYL